MAREMADESFTAMAEAGGNAFLQDKRLNVKFYPEAVRDDTKSEEAGRPIFRERVMVSIAVPGQQDCVKRPAHQGDFNRFPRQHQAFKSGAEDLVVGTPLTTWPYVTVSQVAELATRNIRTVEQLAEMADADAQHLMGNFALRQRAKDFVESSKGSAHVAHLRTELEARDVRLAAMEAQMAKLLGAPPPQTASAPGPNDDIDAALAATARLAAMAGDDTKPKRKRARAEKSA